MSQNGLKRIGFDTFKGLSQLVTLSLDNNKIEKIDANLFVSLSSLS